MKTIFFTSNTATLNEWNKKNIIRENGQSTVCYDAASLKNELKDSEEAAIVIADYDSVASEINSMISSASIPDKLIVLEREPSVVTGRMLILRGTKAYGNSRMLDVHFTQMFKSVANGDIWTYPELTAQLAKKSTETSLDEESKKMLEERLSDKEREVAYLMLTGLTNDAIASSLNITTRTVKAHVSSIFSKLHVSDRVSLILLLK